MCLKWIHQSIWGFEEAWGPKSQFVGSFYRKSGPILEFSFSEVENFELKRLHTHICQEKKSFGQEETLIRTRLICGGGKKK